MLAVSDLDSTKSLRGISTSGSKQPTANLPVCGVVKGLFPMIWHFAIKERRCLADVIILNYREAASISAYQPR
jgi:hypothetical protein